MQMREKLQAQLSASAAARLLSDLKYALKEEWVKAYEQAIGVLPLADKRPPKKWRQTMTGGGEGEEGGVFQQDGGEPQQQQDDDYEEEEEEDDEHDVDEAAEDGGDGGSKALGGDQRARAACGQGLYGRT